MSRRILAVLNLLVAMGLVLTAVAWQAEAKSDRLRKRDQERTQLRQCGDMERDRDRDCYHIRARDLMRNHAALSVSGDQNQKRYRERERYRYGNDSTQNSSENGLNCRWQERHRNRRDQ